MKGGQNLRDLQQERKESEGWVKPQPCHICQKVIPGAYGHTTLEAGVVWSCSKKCEQAVQQLKQGESKCFCSS
jgi:hypothetical protein